jgi:hypothetical protein
MRSDLGDTPKIQLRNSSFIVGYSIFTEMFLHSYRPDRRIDCFAQNARSDSRSRVIAGKSRFVDDEAIYSTLSDCSVFWNPASSRILGAGLLMVRSQ